MGHLYIVRAGKYTKIGISESVGKRIRALQTANAEKIELLASFEFANSCLIEEILHKFFANSRVSGEWFSLSDKDISKAIRVCTELGAKSLASVGKSVGRPQKSETGSFDFSCLAEEKVADDFPAVLHSSLRIERRNDRNPPGYAIYQRGKPVYVGYISGSVHLGHFLRQPDSETAAKNV